ncbi:MAG TPA: O-antigen ligase family protein [Candidatus Dormibacteraeota bacterium]|nr:O-antigen ligase family protein [Candidatus Dormibacteraeota bacterium]
MNHGVATPEAPRLRGLLVRAMAALVLAAVVILPLVFVPNLDDGYALPKVLVLRAFGLVGSIVFLGYVVVWGPLTAKADRRIDLPLACFAGLLLAASLASVDRVQSFAGEAYQYQGLVTVLLYIGSFYVARLSLGSSSGFRAILTATVCVGVVVSVYGIAQAVGFDPFWSGPPDNRVISSVGQPNDLAAYLDLVVIATLGLRPKASDRVRPALDAALVVTLVALALTFSRGGYLGLVAAVCVLAIPRLRVPRRRWVAIGLTGVAVVLATTLALPTVRAFAERVADRAIATGDLREGSIRFHLDQWRVGIQVAVDHPLLGTGPETFPLVFRPYLDRVLPPDRAQLLGRFRLESPHNELIGVAAEMGLPALIAYMAFLVSCAAICVRRARTSDGETGWMALVVLSVLVTHVVTTFFMTPEVSTSEIFWIVMGAGLAATAPETRLRHG